MISLDSFYKKYYHFQKNFDLLLVSLPENVDPKDYNFDHPNAFDFDLFSECCNKLLRRESCQIPLYCFKTNKRFFLFIDILF